MAKKKKKKKLTAAEKRDLLSLVEENAPLIFAWLRKPKKLRVKMLSDMSRTRTSKHVHVDQNTVDLLATVYQGCFK